MSSADKAFSFSDIEDFDDHIASEIRGYDILQEQVRGLAEAFIEDGTRVYDIGCSTGKLINNLAVRLGKETDVSRKKSVCIIGIEPNSNFTNAFSPANEMVQIKKEKVTEDTHFENASLITSLFTLQFVPAHMRAAILRKVYDGLNDNGAFIWAEKVYALDGRIESLLNAQHLQFKRQRSSDKKILDKDERLKSIMRPLDTATNIRMLENAGFKRFEPFWQINNFMAVIAIKS